MNTNWIYSF